MKIKLSFVIPAYNEEEFIGQCLESVLAETKRYSFATEIIVVNNASTDKTKKIAASYRNVKVVDEPKKGLTYARQAGFLASEGELVAGIDADAILPQGWVGKFVKEFDKDPKLVALSGPQLHYDLSILKESFVYLFYFFAYLIYIINRYIFRVGSMIQGGNFVVRRSALEKINGFNTKIRFYGEDTDLAKRLFKVGKVKFSLVLPIYASGRRLKKEGMIVMGVRYALNYFWMIFFKKPFTKTEELDLKR